MSAISLLGLPASRGGPGPHGPLLACAPVAVKDSARGPATTPLSQAAGMPLLLRSRPPYVTSKASTPSITGLIGAISVAVAVAARKVGSSSSKAGLLKLHSPVKNEPQPGG